MKTDYSNYGNIESIPAGACWRYWDCGNIVEGGKENGAEMCNECLDWVRSGGRGHDVEETLTYEE